MGAALVDRGAGQTVRVVHVGGDRDPIRTAPHAPADAQALQETAQEAQAPRSRPTSTRATAGRIPARRSGSRSSRSSAAAPTLAVLGNGAPDMITTDMVITRAVRVHDRRVAQARRRHGRARALAERVRRPGLTARGGPRHRSRDPHPRPHRGPARYAASTGDVRVARGREDRPAALGRRQLRHAELQLGRRGGTPRKAHHARPDLRPDHGRPARAASFDGARAPAAAAAVATGPHRPRPTSTPGPSPARPTRRPQWRAGPGLGRCAWMPRRTRRRSFHRPTAHRRAATGRSA